MALPPAEEIDWDALMRDCAPPEWDLMLSAAAKNDLDRVKDLVENQGVPVSHGNGIGQTVLHLAGLWGHVECVRYLVQAGANVDATNTLFGATPLIATLSSHRISAEQQVAVVKVLVEEGGADPLLEDNYGKCAIDYVDDVSHPLHRKNKQYPELVKKLTPPPPGMERYRMNFLKQIQRDQPSCRTAT